MSKRAAAVVNDRGSKMVVASDEEMAQRTRVAAMIQARMATIATSTEEELWQELRDSVEKERVTFRS